MNPFPRNAVRIVRLTLIAHAHVAFRVARARMLYARSVVECLLRKPNLHTEVKVQKTTLPSPPNAPAAPPSDVEELTAIRAIEGLNVYSQAPLLPRMLLSIADVQRTVMAACAALHHRSIVVLRAATRAANPHRQVKLGADGLEFI